MLLCGNATNCPHLMAEEWTLTDFLHNYFRNPEALVESHDEGVRNATRTLEEVLDERDANPPGGGDDVKEFERRMWEEVPWVACTDGNCSGVMRKEDWLKDRGGMCRDRIVSHLDANPGALAVEMDLCNLNVQMDQLCRSVLEKVLEIRNTNCIASGNDACLPKSFFYTPSTFSASNQQVDSPQSHTPSSPPPPFARHTNPPPLAYTDLCTGRTTSGAPRDWRTQICVRHPVFTGLQGHPRQAASFFPCLLRT